VLFPPHQLFHFHSTASFQYQLGHPPSQNHKEQPGAMSSSGTFHIPFPKNFLAVNTPVKKSSTSSDAGNATESGELAHGFLSNRPATIPRHQSVSSVSSTQSDSAVSAPSSPPSKAADSPVLTAKAFTPLAVNVKHTHLPPASLGDMTPIARGAFLSNRGPRF